MLLLGLALASTGCGGPTEQEVLQIFAAITAAGSVLSKRRSLAGAEFDHFVKGRIRLLVTANGGWKSSPYQSLVDRISAEIDVVAAYVTGRLGNPDSPGELGGVTDSFAPPHTDLGDVAKIRVDDGQEAIDQVRDQSVLDRRRRVRRITWRAVAIHPDLWKNQSSSSDASLNTDGLDDVLDRRLRAVERMIFTDNARGRASWTVGGAQGPWTDKRRTSMFEYPSMSTDGSEAGSFGAALTGAGLTPADLAADWVVSATSLKYKVAAGRITPDAAQHWVRSGWKWVMQLGGKTPSQILDLLIPAASPVPAKFENFWSRNWIFCDHMVSLVAVDALRFALRRRTGSDAEFDTVAGGGVTIGAIIPCSVAPTPSSLMPSGAPYFEGVAIDARDLQIGDIVIIWNSYFYRKIFPTDFGLENAVVVDAEGDEPRKMWLAGHGMGASVYPQFVMALVGDLEKILKKVREKVTSYIGTNDPEHFYLLQGQTISFAANPLQIVFWNPFDEVLDPADAKQELGIPGAWWIRIRLADVELSKAEALNVFPHSVAVDVSYHKPPKGLADASPTFDEAVYVPLSFPKGVSGGWPAYFTKAKEDLANDLAAGGGVLEDAHVDETWAPGFYWSGPGSKIPVLRPKVRP